MNKKGIAFIMTLIVIVTLALLSAAILVRTVTENRNTQTYINKKLAFWLGEAGVQRTLWELNSGAWSGWSGQGNDKSIQASWASAGDYDVTVLNYQSASPQVTAIGYYPSKTDAQRIEHSVTAVLGKSGSLFNYAAFGGASLSISGQGYTNSYNSSLGLYGQNGNQNTEGDVGTNGDITATGQAHVYGDASTGASGTFSDASKVSGAIEHSNNVVLPQVSVPASLQSLSTGGGINSTITLNSGDYKYSYINLSSKKTVTFVGPVNLYLTGSTSLSVSGQGEIVVSSSSTGPVNIYFDGDVDLSGQGITNNTNLPKNLILYGTNTTSQEVKITGQGNFYGAIYAPVAEMQLTGQGALYGAFVGNEVMMSGQGGVHYDEKLAEEAAAASVYVVKSWKDDRTPFTLSQ